MVFSSLTFLFRFLPLVLLVYFIVPFKLKNTVLLIFSLLFYSWGEPKYFFIMIASIVVDFTMSGLIERNRDNKIVCKICLIGSCIFNLGMLMYFKYFDFFIENINAMFDINIGLLRLVLPLGISFYTFQTMSYTIDVYRGKVHAEKNILNFGAFVTLFPQLIAGPIVRYTDINKELKHREVDLSQIEKGISLFILGLAKKVLIANNVGMLWTEVQTLGFSNVSTPLAWLAVLAYALQIYFDFSGYSLMAIGLGNIFGFNFPQNFNFPYVARSATEFWRRWHMTLGSWFREYVYIPLGGNRKGKIVNIINILIVWGLTGFWHGADYNFIIWGLYFAVFLIIEKLWLKKYLDEHKIASHIYLLFVVVVSWAIFASEDFTSMNQLLSKMFSLDFKTDIVYYLRNYIIIIAIAIIFSVEKICTKLMQFGKDIQWFKTIMLIILLIISIAYLVDSTYNPFLYFRF